MKTAEMAIEHVLAGMLMLCGFVLPFIAGLPVARIWEQTGGWVGILGLAYLVGIVFDKAADVVLSPFEHRLRLTRAHRQLRAGKATLGGDPFPQDQLEYALRQDQDGRLSWMNTLRGRIRTARGLAVLGLPAALGLTIAVTVNQDACPAPAATDVMDWPNGGVVLNLALVIASLVTADLAPFKMIRTSGLLGPERFRRVALAKAYNRSVVRALIYYLILVNSALAMASFTINGRDEIYIYLAVGAVSLSLMAFWAWRRITATYMVFLCRKLPELVADPPSNPVT